MKNTKRKCQELYNKIFDAFENQSGGEYNDTIYYHLLGASEDMNEAEFDDDWEGILPTLTDCWQYVKTCKKIDDLQSNMPNEVYC